MSEDPTTGPVATACPRIVPPTRPSEEPTGGRRPLKRSTRIALIVIVTIAVVAAVAFTVNYFVVSSRFVSTDNAQIDGTQIPIVAPASGTLVDWSATAGLGAAPGPGRSAACSMQGAFVQPQLTIRAPAAGTVAVDNTAEGAYVTAGTQLAVAYDMSGPDRHRPRRRDRHRPGAPGRDRSTSPSTPTPTWTSPARSGRSRAAPRASSRRSRSPTAPGTSRRSPR